MTDDGLPHLTVLDGGGETEPNASPISVERQTYGKGQRLCRHLSITLLSDSHRARCRECDIEIDPWEWINRVSHDWAQFIHRYKRAADDAVRMERRLAELRRQEQNTKARLRSARQKLADLEAQ